MNTELSPPDVATIATYDEVERVGRLRLESGEELRFGASACKDFVPVVGAKVFLTVVGPHPMGGRKAITLRASATTEAAVRAQADALKAEKDALLARELIARREAARKTTTFDAIVARIKVAVMPDMQDEADKQLLYELTDDLSLMEPTLEHVRAIMQGIVESPPLAHFGSPGPLVHYSEKVEGHEGPLFEAARAHPRSHFLWMLARLANVGDQEALAILRSHVTHPETPGELKTQIESYLSKR